MDKQRLFIALVLTMTVLAVHTWLFPPAPPRPAGGTAAESAAAASARPAPAAPGAVPAMGAAAPAAAAVPEQHVAVVSPLYRYVFSTRGAALDSAELLKYASYTEPGKHVQLVPRDARDVLGSRVVVGRDTLDLRGASFTPSAPGLDLSRPGAPQELSFTWTGPNGLGAVVTYTFRPDDYRVAVRGRITGLRGPATLLTELGPGLAPHDAPEHGSARELSVVGWNGDATRTLYLRKVEGTDSLPGGPFIWAAVKDRYFLMALAPGAQHPFSHVTIRDVPDVSYVTEGETHVSYRARTTTALPLKADGAFAYDAYLGPQEHSRLAAFGNQLEEVNPYGYRWLRPVIRPIAAAILWVLNELHSNLGIAYGWVLVIFGVMMRVLTWPLNAKAGRAQMRNMEKQPILQERMKEIQKKYADDPRRQQQEMLALYKELDFNPASTFSGCLPMLVPFPVLVTLFFVFQSAIEFRGTSFAWLPDLSLRDPFYILPVFLVLSMFGMQYVTIKVSGMEQNQQTKMMMYIMPLMMGAFFWAMPSGLNLYYATTNVASLPQQYLLARERKRASEAKKAEEAARKHGRKAPLPPGQRRRD